MLLDLLFRSKKPKSFPPCAHRTHESTIKCQECKANKSANTKYRWMLMLCLVWPYALQAMDSTIIASALPWISRDFNKVSEQNWIVSAFNLTSAAFIPFWAQTADVFGRGVAIGGATIVMLVGSALCTGAPTSAFAVLLLGRALQGVAASGLNVLVRTILADGLTLQESAKNWAIFVFVGGTSYAIGPLVGGYLTQVNWRWCFGINLPIAVVALLVIFIFLRKHLVGPQPIPELGESADTGRRTTFVARLKTIDFGGQVLFILGLGLIILGLTWGGATYPWDSAAVIVSLILGVFFMIAFGFWERQIAPGRYLSKMFPTQKAMIPWKLITTRDMGLLFYTECGTGMGMFSVLYFCNIYFIAVKNYHADKAGLQLLYFTPGMAVGVILCSTLCNRWPKMSFPPLFLGTFIETVGTGLLTWALHNGHDATVFGMMALVGVGIGMRFMVSPLHGIGIFKEHRATIIGLMSVAVPLGGTIGLTVMSTIFNNTSGLDPDSTDFSHMHSMVPLDARREALDKIKMSVVWAYIGIIPFMVVSCICTLFLGNVMLSGVSGDESVSFITEPYLWYLFKGKKANGIKEEGIRLNSSQGKGFTRTSAADSEGHDDSVV